MVPSFLRITDLPHDLTNIVYSYVSLEDILKWQKTSDEHLSKDQMSVLSQEFYEGVDGAISSYEHLAFKDNALVRKILQDAQGDPDRIATLYTKETYNALFSVRKQIAQLNLLGFTSISKKIFSLFTSIHSISIGYPSLSDDNHEEKELHAFWPNFIRSFRTLENCRLVNLPLSNIHIESFKLARNLKKLNLNGIWLTLSTAAIQILKNLPLLNSIQLPQGQTSSENLCTLFSSKQFRTISVPLGNISQLTDRVADAIGLSGSTLRTLVMEEFENTTLSEEAVIRLAKKCTSLRKLRLPQCDISDDALEIFLSQNKKISSLSLFYSPTMTERTLLIIANHGKKLRRLDVSGCPTPTDETLRLLATGCPQLEKLSIITNPVLSQSQTEFLRKTLPALKKLTV